MTKSTWPQCAKCAIKDRICQAEAGTGPDFCPTKAQADLVAAALTEYDRAEIRAFAQASSRQEAECYAHRGEAKPYVLHPTKTRVQEIVEFAQKMGYQRLGLAFCAGLRQEARIASDIFEAQGFEVVSAVCKSGATPKARLGLREDEKVRVGEFESMCSPIVQAELLNQAGCHFNVLLGLCVGHDSLFFKYAQAWTTVLVAKDRVTGHNPAAALYTAHSYYARLKRPGIELKGKE